MPTATAAAGVASFINQSSIFWKAESSLEISLGSAANALLWQTSNNINIISTSNILSPQTLQLCDPKAKQNHNLQIEEK